LEVVGGFALFGQVCFLLVSFLLGFYFWSSKMFVETSLATPMAIKVFEKKEKKKKKR
jgi:hypothetical protein